jgi:hypothetical protein
VLIATGVFSKKDDGKGSPPSNNTPGGQKPAGQQWREVSVAEAGASVEFPGEPFRKTKGDKVELSFPGKEVPDDHYFFTVEPLSEISSFRDEIKLAGSRSEKLREFTMGGFRAVSYDGRELGTGEKVGIVAVHTKTHRVLIWVRSKEVADADGKRFLGSLKIKTGN